MFLHDKQYQRAKIENNCIYIFYKIEKKIFINFIPKLNRRTDEIVIQQSRITYNQNDIKVAGQL